MKSRTRWEVAVGTILSPIEDWAKQLVHIDRSSGMERPDFGSQVCQLMKWHQKWVRGVTALFVACPLFISSCSSDVQSGDVDVLVEKDINTWALPSDAYNPPKLSLEYYAVGLEARACRQAAGLPDTVLRFDPNGTLPATSNEAGTRLFDVDIASQYGYHEQLDPRINWDDHKKSDAERSLLSDPVASEAFVACQQQAMRDLGADPEAAYQYGFPDTDVSSDDQAAVYAAVGRWRECVAPLGVADLPVDAGPEGLPTSSQMAKWGLDQDIAPWLVAAPSQEEIEFAVADAKCEDSSGWRQAAYDAQWNAEIEYLKKHYSDLEKQRAKWEALEQTYLETIQELGQSGS